MSAGRLKIFCNQFYVHRNLFCNLCTHALNHSSGQLARLPTTGNVNNYDNALKSLGTSPYCFKGEATYINLFLKFYDTDLTCVTPTPFPSSMWLIPLVLTTLSPWRLSDTTGRIQILVLTNCQAISTEIGTDSLKIWEKFCSFI